MRGPSRRRVLFTSGLFALVPACVVVASPSGPDGGTGSPDGGATKRWQLVLDDGRRWEVRGPLASSDGLLVFRDLDGCLVSLREERVAGVTLLPAVADLAPDATPTSGSARITTDADEMTARYTNDDLPEPYGGTPSWVEAFPATEEWIAGLAAAPSAAVPPGVPASRPPTDTRRAASAMANRIEEPRTLRYPAYEECAGINRINRVNRFTNASLRAGCTPRDAGYQRVPHRGKALPPQER